MPTPDQCPAYAPFFGSMGATAAMVFTGKNSNQTKREQKIYSVFIALGAAYGTARAGVGISASAVLKPEFIMKSVIPVIMAGIIAIYGLVVAVLIQGKIDEKYSLQA